MGPHIRHVVLVVFAAVLVLSTIGAGLGRARVSAQGPIQELFPGWNVVLYGGVGMETPLALNDVRPLVESVWEFHARSQSWTMWSPALPGELTSLQRLERGRIYFVRSLGAGSWTYPLVAPDPQPEPEPEPPTPPGEWRLTFSRTTVLFALEESITIGESGAGESTKDGETAAFTVDAVSLIQVGGLLESNGFFGDWPDDTESGCTSCFHYTLAITSPAGATVTLASDGVGASGDLLALINGLTAILLTAP